MYKIIKLITIPLFFFSCHLYSETCNIYPLTVSQELLSNTTPPHSFKKIPIGVGTGNYSWLSWDGNNDAVSLAESLVPPGDSHNYVNPNDDSDHQLNVSDWVQGRPGVKNSRAIRDNLDALLNQTIVIPVWSEHEGQGSQFNYLVSQFVTIELLDYKLNGKGWVTFKYTGVADCSNDNSPPVAEDLIIDTTESSSLELSVIASDPDNDPLTYVIVTQPENGTLTGEGPNYTYTPNAGFIGDDIFEFLVNDGQVNSNIATTTISVLPIENLPPVASDALVETFESTAFNVTVVATDPENDPLTYEITVPPSHGTLSGSGPDYVYTPDPDFIGDDTFSFVAFDGTHYSNTGTVDIAIVPFGNEPPLAIDAELTTYEESTFEFFVEAYDLDGDPLTYIIVSPPTNGTLTGDGPYYLYTPNNGFIGTDTLQFQVNDGTQNSNIAEVRLIVIPYE